jgi:hypothetical protein
MSAALWSKRWLLNLDEEEANQKKKTMSERRSQNTTIFIA